MTREVSRRYEDPLDRIWVSVAERIGLRIRRTAEAYATTDGRGTLWIGAPETLDADDCLAQMIFHELCHSLVQGPDSFERTDWGLDNEGVEDLGREHACLRVQATLGSRYGLRTVFAPTTDHRAVYDALPTDALAGTGAVLSLARLGVHRASRPPWAPHLGDALRATAMIVQVTAPFAASPSLYEAWEPPRAAHPAGGWVHPDEGDRGCASCAWRTERCVVRARDVQPEWPACEAFVEVLDCRACGACCREGFDVVEVEADDPFTSRHESLLEKIDGRLVLRRLDGRCPPLTGDGRDTPFTCEVYEERPVSCREFERGGESCLEARRRVGLSV